MPTAFSKWVAAAIITFTILLFIFGWVIKYPDVVTGQIKINSNTAPVKLPAHISGKIEILGFNAQDAVKEGEYIAVIQNPANTDDVRKIASLMDKFDPNESESLKQAVTLFPEKVSLGELNMKYYSFLSSLKSIIDYSDDNVYEQQQISLVDGIKWREKILNETKNALSISTENLEISEKWLDKYSSLNKDLVSTYEFEIDRSRIELLSARQNNQNLVKEIASVEMQITESENKLSQLSVERREKERQLHLDLFASYHELNDQIKQWEQTYVLKAPFDGQVEFLKFWANDQLLLIGIISSFSVSLYSQEHKELDLFECIEIASDSSLQAFIAQNYYQSGYWEYRSYKAARLPALSLKMTPVQYNRNIVKRYDF
jgi:BMFP domain-containing protein YqiC